MVDTNSEINYSLYDVYGFILAVQESGCSWFNREYRRLKVNSNIENLNIDLIIKEYDKKDKILPTKLTGDDKGLLFSFGNDSKTVYYNRGISSGFILKMIEPLINVGWDDKCFLHAGAVSKNDSAIVFPAGPDVGKTSMVLQLLQKGYDYLSDDMLIIGNGRAYPFPKLLRIFDYNLISNKSMAKRVYGKRWRLYPLYESYFKIRKIVKAHVPSRKLRFALEAFTPVYYMDIQELFPDCSVSSISSIKHIFFLESYKGDTIEIEDMHAEDLAKRMAIMNSLEHAQFINEYKKYAFEGKRDARIEEWQKHDEQIMFDTFKKTELTKISIPESSKNRETYEKIADFVDKKMIL